MNSHIGGDRAAAAEAMENLSAANSAFYQSALEWRKAPLPAHLYDRHTEICERVDALISFLHDTMSHWKAGLSSGHKFSRQDAKDVLGTNALMKHEIGSLQYELALDIIAHRMAQTADHLH